MSEIALYNLLKRIPDASDDEVEKAVADIASTKEVATKADIVEVKAYVSAEIAKLEKVIAEREARMTWKMVAVGLAVVGLIKYL